jgi:ABC-type multidrug transport system fused ATPase/permease subunit
MGANTLNGLVLLISIGALFALVLARQIPFQIIGRLINGIFRPIGKLLKIKSVPRAAPGSVLPHHMGPSAWAALSRASRTQTETESALGDDFGHEDAHLKRHGFLFNWLNVVVGYIRIPGELSREVAEEYYRLGSEFLNGRVKISANPQNLYEDEEGAVIAAYFPTDAGCLHLLNQMRQTINSNVRKLTVVFSAIIATVLIVNLLYNDGQILDAHAFLGLEAGLALGPFTMTALDINQAIFAVLSTIGGAFAMWIIYFVEYVPYQRNNFRELSNYITRYLARLNDHFRTAEGQAKSVTVGQETDPTKFAHSARKWHTNVLWISLRIFFIESFIRNIMFQMLRNSGYYLVFVPLLFTVVLAGLNLILADQTGFDVGARLADLGIIFVVLFVVLVGIYGVFLRQSMASIDEINQDEWIGFDSLLVENVLGGIVGKYAEDVGYWKNRIGGSF